MNRLTKNVAAVTALVAACASGCASQGLIFTRADGSDWRNDPAARAQYMQDRYRCTQESRVQYSRPGGVYVGYGSNAAIGAAAGLAVGTAIAGAVAENEARKQSEKLALACMEAAGYRLATDAEIERAIKTWEDLGDLEKAYSLRKLRPLDPGETEEARRAKFGIEASK